jgi:hypothetical protein
VQYAYYDNLLFSSRLAIDESSGVMLFAFGEDKHL